MYKILRFDIGRNLDEHRFISENLVYWELVPDFELDESLTNLKFGNYFSHGIEFTLEKGEFYLESVFYSKPYPTASVYNSMGARTFNRKLSYLFSPSRYIKNGFIFTDKDYEDQVFGLNGIRYSENGKDYFIPGFKFVFENDLDFSSDNFIINNSGGSFYLDPGNTNFKNINYDINNYSGSQQPLIYDSTVSSWSYGLNGSLYNVKELTDKNININNSTYTSSYFRDFLNDEYISYLGWFDGFLLDHFDYYSNVPLMNLRYDYNQYYPTINNFYGDTITTTNSYFLYANESNIVLSKGFFGSFNYNWTYRSHGSGGGARFPNYSPHSLNVSILFDNKGFLTEEQEKELGILNSYIDINDRSILDNVNGSDYTKNTNTTGMPSGINTTISQFKLDLNVNNSSLDFSYIPNDEIVFYNEIYFNDDNNYSIQASCLDMSEQSLLSYSFDSQIISPIFDGTMGIYIGGITISGLVVAIFLFRFMFSLVRGIK